MNNKTLTLFILIAAFVAAVRTSLIAQNVNLAVPFKPQVLPGDWSKTKNCGPTCLLMVDGYYKKYIPSEQSIKDINDYMHVGYNGVYTNVTTLSELASNYCKLTNVTVVKPSNSSNAKSLIIKELNEGHPVICAVLIGMSSNDVGHFMVVKGYDNTNIFVNDPGRSTESGQGKNKSYSWNVFLTSWGKQSFSAVTIHHSTAPTPPTTPTLSYPVANATNITRIPSVNLGWAGSNATEYRIQIVDAKSFTGFDATSGFKSICNTCVNENVKSATTYSFKGAAANTTYYWTVRASGTGGVSKFSAYNKFTTASDPATIPVLASPADNASNISTTTPLQFTWSASNATEYRIQIIDELKYTGFDATNGFANNCATCLKTVHLANQSSYSLSNLEAGKTYYWTVRANGLGGTSKYATVRKFKTAGGAVPAPTIQPSSVSICQGATTTLSATGCSGTITWNDGKTGPSRSMSPTATATYTATCTVGGKVSSNSNTSTITVNANPTTPTLTASSTTVNLGGSSTLTASNCNGVVYWNNNLGTGTSKVVTPNTNTLYAANCHANNCVGTDGTIQILVKVPAPVISSNVASVCSGQAATLTASGCSNGTINWNNSLGSGVNKTAYPTSTTIYNASCTINGVTSSGSNNVQVTVNKSPSAPSLSANPTSITSGNSSTLSATNCNGNVSWNNGSTGSSSVVRPTSTTTYTATCTTNGCKSSSGSVTVSVSTPTPSTSNPSIGTYTSCSGSGSQSSSCGSFLIGIIRAKVTSINNGYATIVVSRCNGGSFSTAGTAYAKQSNICGSILTSKPYTLGSGDVTLSVPVSVGSTSIYITANSNTGDKFTTGIITINRSNSAARVSAEEQVLSDNSDQEMVIYPNPTAGEFKIKLANHISKDEVVLIHINSLTNTEFHEEKRVSIIELENIIFHLPQGLYTVNIEIPTLEKFLSSKIIVTK